MDAIGASSGIAIAWNAQAIELTDIHANHHFIQAKFHVIGTNVHGHLTNVYFLQTADNKIAILDTIALLNANKSLPLWIIGVDFNMITELEEKIGGRIRLETESEHFKKFIQSNWLIDFPRNNGIFTWNNKKSSTHQIASRLDRFLISDNAIHLGEDLTTSILPYVGSDHWPISFQWQRLGVSSKRPFHFESFWLIHPQFKDLVQQTRKSLTPPAGSKMFQFQQKL